MTYRESLQKGLHRARSREAGRQRWNADMVEERRRLGLPTANLDWDTAMYLYDQGMTPAQAAPRIKVR